MYSVTLGPMLEYTYIPNGPAKIISFIDKFIH